MSEAGRVSIVFPCYNAEAYLREATDSLLAQEYADIEILALDDGSSDATRSILEEYAERDSRVRLMVNPENLGLIRTLNRGVQAAEGEFIARMDSDDVAVPERIGRQVDVLRSRPDIDVVGVGARTIDPEGAPLRFAPPRATLPGAVSFLGLFASPLIHPGMLARAEVMRRFEYRLVPEVLHTEDYDLFSRMLAQGVGVANLPDPLLQLRVQPDSVSHRFEATQVANFAACARRHLTAVLGIDVPEGEHRVVVNRMPEQWNAADLRRGLARIGEIRGHFLELGKLDEEERREVDAIVDQQRIDVLIQATKRGVPRVQATAAALVPAYAGSLLSAAGRDYLADKFGRGKGV